MFYLYDASKLCVHDYAFYGREWEICDTTSVYDDTDCTLQNIGILCLSVDMVVCFVKNNMECFGCSFSFSDDSGIKFKCRKCIVTLRDCDLRILDCIKMSIATDKTVRLFYEQYYLEFFYSYNIMTGSSIFVVGEYSNNTKISLKAYIKMEQGVSIFGYIYHCERTEDGVVLYFMVAYKTFKIKFFNNLNNQVACVLYNTDSSEYDLDLYSVSKLVFKG